MSITSPLKTVTDPLKEIRMVETGPKMVPSQIFFLLVPLVTIAQLFMKKKNFHFTIPLSKGVKCQLKTLTFYAFGSIRLELAHIFKQTTNFPMEFKNFEPCFGNGVGIKGNVPKIYFFLKFPFNEFYRYFTRQG